ARLRRPGREAPRPRPRLRQRQLPDTWRSSGCSTSRRRSSPSPPAAACPASSRESARSSSTASRSSLSHELAQVVVWSGYIQWLYEHGFGIPSAPILRPLDNIRRMHAILTHDPEGRPIEPQGPEADVIIDNPPFLGGK